MDADAVKKYLLDLQQRIVGALQALDGRAFRQDAWQRDAKSHDVPGNGITCILEQGRVFERGGVAFSHVIGDKLPPSATAARPELANRPWQAMGVSLVLHPLNPYVPTVHLNVRFFVAGDVGDADGKASKVTSPPEHPVWWFGGGMDLTPYYGFEEDAVHFHRQCRDAVDGFGADYYPRFKASCDKYFFLKHRNEPRGVGGIFFDDFQDKDFEFSFGLMRSVGDHFLPAYLPIAERREETPYSGREREFQAYRRGRYVEFNLVWDRGTLFGLQSGGRTEAILLSMPPRVSWRYDWHPEPASPEAELYEKFLRPRDWL